MARQNCIAAPTEDHIAAPQRNRTIHGVAIATNEYRVHRRGTAGSLEILADHFENVPGLSMHDGLD